jgi:hypothetical protein
MHAANSASNAKIAGNANNASKTSIDKQYKSQAIQEIQTKNANSKQSKQNNASNANNTSIQARMQCTNNAFAQNTIKMTATQAQRKQQITQAVQTLQATQTSTMQATKNSTTSTINRSICQQRKHCNRSIASNANMQAMQAMQGCHFRPQPGRTELDATSAHPIEREG